MVNEVIDLKIEKSTQLNEIELRLITAKCIELLKLSRNILQSILSRTFSNKDLLILRKLIKNAIHCLYIVQKNEIMFKLPNLVRNFDVQVLSNILYKLFHENDSHYVEILTHNFESILNRFNIIQQSIQLIEFSKNIIKDVIKPLLLIYGYWSPEYDIELKNIELLLGKLREVIIFEY